MENILKILITFAFLSLLVDAAVSISLPPAARNPEKFKRAVDKAKSQLPNFGSKLPNFKNQLEFKRALDKAKSQFPGITKKIHALQAWFRLQQRWRKAGRVSAFDDCIVMTADSIDQIKSSVEIFEGVEWSKDGILSLNATQKVQLNNLLSAAQTNVLTCLDGFTHTRADKKDQADILKADLMVLHRGAGFMLSITNSLKVKEAETEIVPPGDDWPEWLSAEERTMLLHRNPEVVHATVALDKSGDYKTVSDAVNAVRVKMMVHPSLGKRYVIRIKAGKYMENVVIPKDMKNLTFIGDGSDKTFIIASQNVVDGSTTFNSATVGVAGDGFLASGITFENAAGPSKNQAVALRVNADRAAFYGCNMIGHQNTLYVHSFRQFYKSCTIRGTVDFIFGNAAAFLYNCNIEARVPKPGQKNTITAQGRDNINQTTGIVIRKSRIRAAQELKDFKEEVWTYLGRPWKEYSRTVVMETDISNVIHPNGWLESRGEFALNTLDYAEYMNTGDGAKTESRVKWKGFRVLTEKEVEPFTLRNFIGGKS
ncbi:hypothetical protein SASPL_151833 [Salvia splendens]|uniref:Pectinesterase n=1 Tax=Salvia splendens TaxID=180675 RepID=A0A8X8W2F0_SALSN|nr:pectinesterase-like [Salvia splendens]KAG6386664.1 hypothetical protein SASPL_151833 [Salvia splendens]